MIIGVDIREWQPGYRTGIGRFLEELLRTATACRPRDRFLLIGNSTCEVRVCAENVDVVKIPERWTLWWDQVTLARALSRNGADVFFSPYIKVPLFTRIPVISTIHDLAFFVLDQSHQRIQELWLTPPFRLFCLLVVRRAAAILTDSETSARDVRRLLGADPSLIRVVPLATASHFRPTDDAQADAEVLNRYGLSPGYVVYVGGFSPPKNVRCLIQAHAAMPESLRTRHPLVLVGGPVPSDLRRLCEGEAKADGSRCIGVVPDDDLPALYRRAAIFACPSRYEGFGLPVLEAMACGVPVLCSTTPALVELAGGAAQHVDPDDSPGWTHALENLLSDATLRKHLGAAGRVRSAAFTSRRMTDEILKVIDEVMACKR